MQATQEETTGWKQAFSQAGELLVELGLTKEQAVTELSYALHLFEENPRLKTCAPDSILIALQNIGRTKISVNPAQKLAYVDERDGKCYFELTYKGLIKVLTDSGSVKVIDPFIVYEDEEFDYSPADNFLTHIPRYASTEAENRSRGIKGAYSRAILHDDTPHFHFVEVWKLEKVEKMSRMPQFYQDWKEDMYKKTALRSHYKYLPKKDLPDFIAHALILDEDNFFGRPSRRKTGLLDFFANNSEIK